MSRMEKGREGICPWCQKLREGICSGGNFFVSRYNTSVYEVCLSNEHQHIDDLNTVCPVIYNTNASGVCIRFAPQHIKD